MKHQFVHTVRSHQSYKRDDIRDLQDHLDDGAKVVRCDAIDDDLIYILEDDDGSSKKEKIQIEVTIKEKTETKKKVIEKVIETVNSYHLLDVK